MFRIGLEQFWNNSGKCLGCPVVHQVPIDAAILAAGDHNGSTFYQHQRFLDVVRGRGSVEVTLEDGIWAVRMGQAAQKSAATGKAVTF